MPVRTILQLGDPRLREIAMPVVNPRAPEIAALIADLTDSLAHARATTGYGRAIAAPQIGVLERVILLHLPGSEPLPLINPEITVRSAETHAVWDLCLSFLSIACQVERHVSIAVRHQDQHGVLHDFEAGLEQDLSELLQHEIDHLDGILTLDRLTDMKTLIVREEFEKRYRPLSPYAATA